MHTSARDKHVTGAQQTSYNFLSRQRFFFRDRLLNALCRDRELSVAAGNVRPRVATEFLCCDRVWAGTAEARDKACDPTHDAWLCTR